jgi:hypothetical protein
VRQISKPFDWYCDRSREKDLEVAFAWQSGHRPLLRGAIYGLDAAYPDSLQPSLLRIYEWASSEWHRFLQIEVHTGSSITISPAQKVFRSEVQSICGEEGDATTLKRKPLCDDVSRSPSSKQARLGLHEASTISRRRTEEDGGAAEERRPDKGDIRDPTRMASAQSKEPATNPGRVSECGRVAYAADYKVVICIPCGHCIKPPPYAIRHFKDMHSNWPLRARKALVKHIDDLCLVEPESLAYSRQSVLPVPYLPIPDGWECLRCEYSCVSEGTMQTHANMAHRWLRGHGRVWKAAQVQTFLGGSNRRFLRIDKQLARSPEAVNDLSRARPL